MIRAVGRSVANLAVGTVCFVLLPTAAGIEYVKGDRTFRSAARVAWLSWLWTFTTEVGTDRERRIWKALTKAEERRK